MKANTKKSLDRRTFLKVTSLAGGGVALGLYAGTEEVFSQRGFGPPPPPPTPDVYITINANNRFTIIAKNPETGQGIKAALPMIIADELDVDWNQVDIRQADLNPIYGRQIEGGSTAIPSNYTLMRQVGAGGRAMVLAAAAQTWNVPVGQLSTASGVVTHAASGRTATYGSLAATVATLDGPDVTTVPLKNPADFKIVGQPLPGVENFQMVTGQPIYSIDLEPEGMLFAAYHKCPVFGGVAQSANVDEIQALPGIQHAFIVDADGPASGVAIVADNWWVANNARQQLDVTWDEGATAVESTTRYNDQAASLSAQASEPPAGGGRGSANIGDVEGAFADADQVVESEYYFPLLSHAPLEPMNSTAHYRQDGTLEIWSPSQIPGLAGPARAAGIENDAVTMHLVRSGGGFGRRLYSEYDIEIGAISRQVSEERMAAGLETVPVKLLWTREDDMHHDMYRPAGYHFFKAGLDANGRVTAFRDFVPSISSVVPANEFPRGFVPNFMANSINITPFSIPTGAMRAPGSNGISFVMQSFIDELAVAAGQDPLQFRLDMLANPVPAPPAAGGRGGGGGFGGGGFNAARATGVMEAVRRMSNWDNTYGSQADGRGLGCAFQFAHAGYVAYVVDVTVSGNRQITVNNVWAAVDIGSQIVNPSRSRNLVEGGFVEGMSHMMNWEITIENGAVVQNNFPQYQPTRISQTPPNIEVEFVITDNSPTGLGEPSLPPAIPAIANAVFDATGERIRKLPMRNDGYAWT